MVNKFKKNQILIVEDQEDMREMIVCMLKDAGMKQVLAISDGDQAIKYIKKSLKHLDLVVCDWNIPVKSGVDVLRELRMLSREIPFLMVTGRKDMNSVFEAQKLGVTDYLSKPFSPNIFEAKVRKLLSES